MRGRRKWSIGEKAREDWAERKNGNFVPKIRQHEKSRIGNSVLVTHSQPIRVGEASLKLSAGCNVARASLNVQRGRRRSRGNEFAPECSFVEERLTRKEGVRSAAFFTPPRENGNGVSISYSSGKKIHTAGETTIGSSWVYQYRVGTVYHLNSSPAVFRILMLSAIAKNFFQSMARKITAISETRKLKWHETHRLGARFIQTGKSEILRYKKETVNMMLQRSSRSKINSTKRLGIF